MRRQVARHRQDRSDRYKQHDFPMRSARLRQKYSKTAGACSKKGVQRPPVTCKRMQQGPGHPRKHSCSPAQRLHSTAGHIARQRHARQADWAPASAVWQPMYDTLVRRCKRHITFTPQRAKAPSSLGNHSAPMPLVASAATARRGLVQTMQPQRAEAPGGDARRRTRSAGSRPPAAAHMTCSKQQITASEVQHVTPQQDVWT